MTAPDVAMVLTRREAQCLQLLASGLSNQEISARLVISMPTVAMHIANARRRLGAKTREHAVALALSSGEIKIERPVPAAGDGPAP
ncbi:MAG: helix-turn-helix transcriptional regulator [Hyphomicrobiaceae bacterium]|nr:helix-turn-helix transcriptional regulator [Hyphomicrobiaceae bacterium]